MNVLPIVNAIELFDVNRLVIDKENEAKFNKLIDIFRQKYSSYNTTLKALDIFLERPKSKNARALFEEELVDLSTKRQSISKVIKLAEEFIFGINSKLDKQEIIAQENGYTLNTQKDSFIIGHKGNIKLGRKQVFSIDPRSLIESQEVQTDGVLSMSSTIIGVISLEIFARRHKPTYILGVNRGGWLLSTYLAQRLNINRDRLFRFDESKDDIIDNISHSNDIYTNKEVDILLVDDISRTGNSIDKAIKCVKDKFSVSTISVGVLVICGRESDQNIDYNPYKTKYIDIELPWSSSERKAEARKNIRDQGHVAQLGDHYSLNENVSILRIADDQTKEGSEFDIYNGDIENIINIFQRVFLIPA